MPFTVNDAMVVVANVEVPVTESIPPVHKLLVKVRAVPEAVAKDKCPVKVPVEAVKLLA